MVCCMHGGTDDDIQWELGRCAKLREYDGWLPCTFLKRCIIQPAVSSNHFSRPLSQSRPQLLQTTTLTKSSNFKLSCSMRASVLPRTDQKCSNGLAGFEAANVCCPLWCGRCGGKGCSEVGKECCTSDVKDTKVKCSKSGSAPCIIDGKPEERPVRHLYLSSWESMPSTMTVVVVGQARFIQEIVGQSPWW